MDFKSATGAAQGWALDRVEQLNTKQLIGGLVRDLITSVAAGLSPSGDRPVSARRRWLNRSLAGGRTAIELVRAPAQAPIVLTAAVARHQIVRLVRSGSTGRATRFAVCLPALVGITITERLLLDWLLTQPRFREFNQKISLLRLAGERAVDANALTTKLKQPAVKAEAAPSPA